MTLGAVKRATICICHQMPSETYLIVNTYATSRSGWSGTSLLEIVYLQQGILNLNSSMIVLIFVCRNYKAFV